MKLPNRAIQYAQSRKVSFTDGCSRAGKNVRCKRFAERELAFVVFTARVHGTRFAIWSGREGLVFAAYISLVGDITISHGLAGGWPTLGRHENDQGTGIISLGPSGHRTSRIGRRGGQRQLPLRGRHGFMSSGGGSEDRFRMRSGRVLWTQRLPSELVATLAVSRRPRPLACYRSS